MATKFTTMLMLAFVLAAAMPGAFGNRQLRTSGATCSSYGFIALVNGVCLKDVTILDGGILNGNNVNVLNGANIANICNKATCCILDGTSVNALGLGGLGLSTCGN